MNEDEFFKAYVQSYEDVGKRIYMTASLVAQKQIY